MKEGVGMNAKWKKQQFIEAYCWSYGSTKKHAEQVYKQEAQSYIEAIIEGYKHHLRTAAQYGD